MWLVTENSIINMDNVSSIRIFDRGSRSQVRVDSPVVEQLILKQGSFKECQEFFKELLLYMKSPETDWIDTEYLE